MKGKIDLALHPVDDLFTTEDLRQEKKHERLMDIPIELISDFPDHPYKVLDDESMSELVESIKACGVIQPVIVREKDDGESYEMVSGHRRKHACELAGIKTIPCRVQDLSRDDAVIAMVDSNLQREVILPSEKARAYKMRLDSMRRQAGRPSKDNYSPAGNDFQGVKSSEMMATEVGESKNQIFRYIRLNDLVPSLLDMVDEKKIALRPAVEISYLTKEEQNILSDSIEYNDATPSHAQTIKNAKVQRRRQADRSRNRINYGRRKAKSENSVSI